MRVGYLQNPPAFESSEQEKVYDETVERRGDHGLLPLDHALLHSPAIADGWNTMFNSIRTKSLLPSDLREICMLRPALHNKAWFEWRHHLPIYQSNPTYTSQKLDTISDPNPTNKGALSQREWLVLRYADAMTKGIKVEQDLFEEMRSSDHDGEGFSEQEIVELTATCAGYNMVSRFLVALDVAEMNDKPPEEVSTPSSDAAQSPSDESVCEQQ